MVPSLTQPDQFPVCNMTEVLDAKIWKFLPFSLGILDSDAWGMGCYAPIA